MTHNNLIDPGAAPTRPAYTPRETLTIATAAGPVRVESLGDGPPLLFAGDRSEGHGWDAVAFRLAAQFRCLLAELPAGAASARRHDVSVLDEVVWALGPRAVTLVADESFATLAELRAVSRTPKVAGVAVLTQRSARAAQRDPAHHFIAGGRRRTHPLRADYLGVRATLITGTGEPRPERDRLIAEAIAGFASYSP